FSISSLLPTPPRSPLFPYTTLFRSQIPVWHDTASLFNHMIVQLGDDPYRSDIDRRLGMLYATADPPDWDKAEQAFSRGVQANPRDRKSTRLNSSHDQISYAVFCLKK